MTADDIRREALMRAMKLHAETRIVTIKHSMRKDAAEFVAKATALTRAVEYLK